MAKTKRIIGFIVAVVALVGAFALSACSKKEADGSTTEYSFNIGKTAISLEVGESEKLECRYGDKTIVFVSSDPNVATVAADGTITAVAAGTAYVTAGAEGVDGASKICKVTVTKSVYAVSLDRSGEIEALAGTALEFNAAVAKNGEKTALVATFTVSPEGCTISADGNTARITFAQPGTYAVKAEYGDASAIVTVTVVGGIAE